MDTVTYPDERVASFIRQHSIPVRIPVREKPDLTASYGIIWTPNVILCDETGKEQYRIEGYLPPETFVGQLALGVGRCLMNRQDFPQAIRLLEEVAQRHADDETGIEALYWLAVAQYKNTRDPAQLYRGWEKLVREHPDSIWAKRANVPKKSS